MAKRGRRPRCPDCDVAMVSIWKVHKGIMEKQGWMCAGCRRRILIDGRWLVPEDWVTSKS